MNDAPAKSGVTAQLGLSSEVICPDTIIAGLSPTSTLNVALSLPKGIVRPRCSLWKGCEIGCYCPTLLPTSLESTNCGLGGTFYPLP